jgi:hypothetical protein
VPAGRLLVASARLVGCIADIAVFFPGMPGGPSLDAAIFGQGVVLVHQSLRGGSLGLEEQWLGTAASFLNAHKTVYMRSMVTDADTVFQMDPIATVEMFNFSSVFLSQRAAVPESDQGVCGRMRHWPRNQLVLPSLSMGVVPMHVQFLLQLLDARARIKLPTCNLLAVTQRAIWEKWLPKITPITLYSQDDGPFASWRAVHRCMQASWQTPRS